ncbi:hypothetical protein HDU67_007908 [Dinochytrium kinnereticum]|nr:hypothetical protein HDU67_007908 [Dinochytrium kinnereticum]
MLSPSILLASIASLALVSAQSQQPKWPVFERDGKQAVLNAVQNFVSAAEANFANANLTRLPSPANWADEVVYHIVPDRFNDGDPSRNGFNLPRNGQAEDQPKGNFYNVNEWRQGGDLAGIQQRIDYIADLGATVLWITPVVKHDGAYHGYCTTDPTVIDPGFGSNEDYRNLVQYAHSKNIKVVMDLVVNHLCDVDTYYSAKPSNRYECANTLNQASWTGGPSDDSKRGTLKFSPNFFGPLQSQYFFARCGPNGNDDTTGQGPATVYGDFTDGYFDYDTRNYDFQEVYTAIHKYWIAYADVDGFRLDAAKHISEDFIAHFSTNIRDYANKLKKDNFYIIGEVAADVQWEGRRLGSMFHTLNNNNPDPRQSVPATLTTKIRQLSPIFNAHPKAKYPGLNAIYDFFLGGTTRKIILEYAQKADGTSLNYDSSPSRIADYFNNQYQTVASQGNMGISWTPLEIHDWPRLLKNELDRDPIATIGLSMAFLMTIQGQPIIYYGSEQGFSGDCNYSKITGGNQVADNHLKQVCAASGYDGASHSSSRAAFFTSSGWKLRTANPKTDALASVGPFGPYVKYDWRNDPYLDMNNFIYVHTRRLVRIRRSCAALKSGKTFVRKADDYGLLAFSRISDYESVILMNMKRNGPYTVNSWSIYVDAGVAADTKFVNILNPTVTAFAKAANGGGKVLDFGPGNLTLEKRGYAIFVPASVLGEFDSYYQTYVCKA